MEERKVEHRRYLWELNVAKEFGKFLCKNPTLLGRAWDEMFREWMELADEAIERSELYVASTKLYSKQQTKVMVDAIRTMAASGITVAIVDLTPGQSMLQALLEYNKDHIERAWSVLGTRRMWEGAPRVVELPVDEATKAKGGRIGWVAIGYTRGEEASIPYCDISQLKLGYDFMDFKIVFTPVGQDERSVSVRRNLITECHGGLLLMDPPHTTMEWFKQHLEYCTDEGSTIFAYSAPTLLGILGCESDILDTYQTYLLNWMKSMNHVDVQSQDDTVILPSSKFNGGHLVTDFTAMNALEIMRESTVEARQQRMAEFRQRQNIAMHRQAVLRRIKASASGYGKAS